MLTYGVLGLTLLALPHPATGLSFGWFALALLLVSPITSSYHMLLAVLPVALLMDGASRRRQVLLLALLLLATMPFAVLPFRRTLALAALWLMTGIPLMRVLKRRELTLAAAALVVVAAVGAWRQLDAYHREPAQMHEAAPLPHGTLYASLPKVTEAGLTYEGIRSQQPARASAASADGRFRADTRGGQLVLIDQRTNEQRTLTPAHCNSHSPAWSPDSRFLYFASDCGRGFGLPALFRVAVR